MSKMFAPLPAGSDSAFFEGFSARMFGAFIESAREKAGRSIEQAAMLAGISATQWTAIEAGNQLPSTRSGLRALADAAGIEWDTMASIVLLCRQAWGV